MSLYEYVCNHGHGHFEVKQAMLDEHKANCPTCHKSARRIFSPLPTHWGWDFDESSHHVGNPTKLVSDKPSNEGYIRV